MKFILAEEEKVAHLSLAHPQYDDSRADIYANGNLVLSFEPNGTITLWRDIDNKLKNLGFKLDRRGVIRINDESGVSSLG